MMRSAMASCLLTWARNGSRGTMWTIAMQTLTTDGSASNGHPYVMCILHEPSPRPNSREGESQSKSNILGNWERLRAPSDASMVKSVIVSKYLGYCPPSCLHSTCKTAIPHEDELVDGCPIETFANSTHPSLSFTSCHA